MSAAATIRVSADAEGLRLAARELMIESIDAEREEQFLRMASAGEPEEIVKRLRPRTLSPGYYERALYLFELERTLAAGFQIPLADVEPSEVDGLLAVRAGRAEFERDYPPCPQCGSRNSRFAFKCRCGQDLGGKS